MEIIPGEVVDVQAKGNNSYFLKTDGTLWGMGNNYAGQLNSADLGVNQLTPVQIASSIQRFFAGLNYLIYEKTDGTLWSVGRNVFGQLGDERQDTHLNTPTVLFDQNVSSVAAGRNIHSFVIKSDGSLWGMGNGGLGRLGDGTGTPLEQLKLLIQCEQGCCR